MLGCDDPNGSARNCDACTVLSIPVRLHYLLASFAPHLRQAICFSWIDCWDVTTQMGLSVIAQHVLVEKFSKRRMQSMVPTCTRIISELALAGNIILGGNE
jgi:hypothetical protein